MRTTLEIDDDVLAAAKELGRREHKTAGEIISTMTRRALTGAAAVTPHARKRNATGFRPFASRGGVVTNAGIDRLRDESGI